MKTKLEQRTEEPVTEGNEVNEGRGKAPKPSLPHTFLGYLRCLLFKSCPAALLATLVALLSVAVLAEANPMSERPVPVPLDQLGALATKQVEGDSLTITPVENGARLRCAFQRLEGQATPEGLWLSSTAERAKGQPFRVVATKVGRAAEADILGTEPVHAAFRLPPGFGVRWQSGAATRLFKGAPTALAPESGVPPSSRDYGGTRALPCRGEAAGENRPPQSKVLARTGLVTVDKHLVR